ncbi:MAG: hypothetical protein K8I30_18125, partial [Anaerolineae bacterium]|nr:hypothetical protein [Anaerolineae bacterium]
IVVAMFVVGVISFVTAMQFLRSYGLNVDYVYQQPLQMARWLEANTSPDAVIAVHDVGMMRYMGGRTTLDMVGLTTPGPADYWRNGPGSVAEFLIANHPDYIASYGYGHGFGLGMLADTDLYGDPLASFSVDLDPNYNVALAANFQGIYQPNWEKINSAIGLAVQPSICDNYFPACIFPRSDGIYVLGEWIAVANIDEEKRHNYRWLNSKDSMGFPSEVQELDYIDCYESLCRVIDGGRRINGEESFEIGGRVDLDYALAGELLITRLQPVAAGTIDIYVDDKFLATRWIPAMPGRWLEVPTLIPPQYFTASHNELQIRIVPHIPDGYYMPYNHLIYYYPYDLIPKKPAKQISMFQDGAIVLASATIDYTTGAKQMPIEVDWYTDGGAQGDYKVFVHILDDNDQIVAQADTYPGSGTLPPGNWLPGILHDTIMIDVDQVPAGIYRVAIGLYNPYTFERLQPTGGDDQNRFFIGEVEIR